MRRSKLATMEEVVALVEPGSTLAFGGAVHANRPAAFVRALIRRGTGELVLNASPGSGWDVDLLVGCGRVGKTVLPMVTMAEHGLAPCFRGAAEAGEIETAYIDTMSVVAAYLAGAYGHPFHFIRGLEGTDIVDDPEFYDVLTDSSGGRHRAVRAMTPDVGVLHVEEADEFGNVRHARGRVLDVMLARAAKRTVVQAERIVSNAEVRRDPIRTTIAAQYVHAVVETPFGAHPTACAEYQTDDDHLRAYAQAAEARRRGEPEAYDAYLQQYVLGPRDESGYREAIGGAETERRLREAMRGSHG
ncbi:MAG: CoA transferase subunit A [Actinobacteria bacterium]|nr:CoA transferase subunit A [Actinomycetota bacterium]